MFFQLFYWAGRGSGKIECQGEERDQQRERVRDRKKKREIDIECKRERSNKICFISSPPIQWRSATKHFVKHSENPLYNFTYTIKFSHNTSLFLAFQLLFNTLKNIMKSRTFQGLQWFRSVWKKQVFERNKMLWHLDDSAISIHISLKNVNKCVGKFFKLAFSIDLGLNWLQGLFRVQTN